MDNLLAVAVAAIGVIGQWAVGARASARHSGKVDEKMQSYGVRISNVEKATNENRDAIHEVGERVSTIEGRLGAGGRHPAF